MQINYSKSLWLLPRAEVIAILFAYSQLPQQLISPGIAFCLTLQQSLNKIFAPSPGNHGKDEENFTLYLQRHLWIYMWVCSYRDQRSPSSNSGLRFCSLRNMKAFFTKTTAKPSTWPTVRPACKPQIHTININYVDKALDYTPRGDAETFKA